KWGCPPRSVYALFRLVRSARRSLRLRGRGAGGRLARFVPAGERNPGEPEGGGDLVDPVSLGLRRGVRPGSEGRHQVGTRTDRLPAAGGPHRLRVPARFVSGLLATGDV